ncbi:outer membrane lipoprotein chaperone LolA [Aidingimonas halophila]|uniref:Outer-membrane lipoprotein carrier protein n=1 Tax=Aidingimonas halophila TaxID=574349 RepID=A0A1H3EM50_9GAMM|nr:outer membrane lipoprotein chaperone LolA [Aidingimonas halophila]GHC31388.1 outer-membrane lipoprotein carrier protein [Aidingimonas halophila]SDX79822.1 outer membrane lipoprotein carrier protein [Aidingimonas halophila]
MKLKTSLLALPLATLLPMTAIANEDADRLTDLLEPLETYRADFEQQILDGGGERLQEAQGRMWLSRPGLFRWEVDAPYQQEVVSDGDEVYLYDPDLEQVTVQSLDRRVTHTPALLLSGSTSDLTESYDVSHREQDGHDVFTLTPRDADTLFEELSMAFDDDRLTMLDMTDSTGQRTAIEFSSIEVNADIDDSQFEFDIPDGADVIREDE